MAYSLLTHAIGGSADDHNAQTTPDIDTTGADALFFAITKDATRALDLVVDDNSNSFTALTLRTSTGADVIIYYSNPAINTSSANHAFCNIDSGAAGFPSIALVAFSGSKQTSPFDVESGASGAAASTLQPGSITPTENNCLVLTAVSHVSAATPTIDSGFTVIDSVVTVGGQHYGLAVAYKIQTTAAAVNPTWSGTSLQSAAIASFKAAAGATVTTKKLAALGVG